MKTKAAKQPKQAKPTVHVKDLKPKNNPKGGSGSLADGRYMLHVSAKGGS